MTTEDSEPTASVVDVAAYLIEKLGGKVEAEKLHCLLYYCQAWSLAWDGEALFPEEFEAWPAGLLSSLHESERVLVDSAELREEIRRGISDFRAGNGASSDWLFSEVDG